jgi:hypothetical protein
MHDLNSIREKTKFAEDMHGDQKGLTYYLGDYHFREGAEKGYQLGNRGQHFSIVV